MFKILEPILYWFFFLLTLTTANISVHESSKDHEPLANAVLYVTNRYISNRSNTVVVMQMCKYCTSIQQNFHCRLLDFILLNFEISFTRLLFVGETDDQPWNYNIFIIDSSDAFDDQIERIQLKLYETNFYVLVVLTHTKNLSSDQLQSNMIRIINGGLRLYIINVVIMIEDQNGEIVLYRSSVYGRDCGYKILVNPFNKFHAGKLHRNFLFPHRQRNFDNCTLRVAAYGIPPMLIFNGDKNNESHLRDSSRLEGIDGYLLRILGETMNFRLNLTFPLKRGEVFDNGTATGPFALLRNDTTDLVIGGYGTQDNYRTYFTASIVYHQSPHVVVVRSGLQYSPLKQLMCPFKNELWNLLVALCLISFGLIVCLKKRANDNIYIFFFGLRENRYAVFNLIVFMIGLPVSYLPKRHCSRMLIICWIFFTFVLRNIYQGKMFDSLRVARRIPLPHRLDDLIQQQFYMISRDYYDFYPHNLTWIMNEDYPVRYATLESADDSVRVGCSSLLDYLAYHNQLHWRTSRLTVVNDPIYLFQMVMYFKKHSRFKFTFDLKLKQLMHSGIVSHIAKQYVKREFWVMNEQNMEVPQIGNEMLYGLYAVYAVLVGFAIIVFALEMLTQRLGWLQLLVNRLSFYQ